MRRPTLVVDARHIDAPLLVYQVWIYLHFDCCNDFGSNDHDDTRDGKDPNEKDSSKVCGIGRGIARRLAAAGAHVFVSARSVERSVDYEGTLEETIDVIRILHQRMDPARHLT